MQNKNMKKRLGGKTRRLSVTVDGDLAIERGQVALSFLMSVAKSGGEGYLLMKAISNMLEREYKIRPSYGNTLKLISNKLWPKIETTDFQLWLATRNSEVEWSELVERGKLIVGALRCIAPSPCDGHVISKAIAQFFEVHGYSLNKHGSGMIKKLSKVIWPGTDIDKVELNPINLKTGIEESEKGVTYSEGEKTGVKEEKNIMFG